MAKQIVYGEEARKKLESGINQLANTDKINFVLTSSCLLYERN